MANYWHPCINCETTIKQEKKPSSPGCSKATFHSWKKLAVVGNTKY